MKLYRLIIDHNFSEATASRPDIPTYSPVSQHYFKSYEDAEMGIRFLRREYWTIYGESNESNKSKIHILEIECEVKNEN